MYTAQEVDARIARMKAEGRSNAEIIDTVSELCIGWPYVFGAAGEMCTPDNRKKYAGSRPDKKTDIYSACPALSGNGSCDSCKWCGTRIYDCRGFTRWLLAQVDLMLYGGTVTAQWETSSNWVYKGSIDKMPLSLVCCVFREGHTGMHLFGDVTRHCNTYVKEQLLPGVPTWKQFGIPAGMYTNEELRKAGLTVDESKNIPTLRNGSRGSAVKELQSILNIMSGASLSVDGIFGKATEEAVRKFQREHGLTADGIVGPKTRKALGLIDSRNQQMDTGNNDLPVDRAKYLWDKLFAAIRNPFGVAGLMGNLEAESGLIPNNLQNTGNKSLGMTDAEYTAAVDSGAYDQFENDGQGYGLAQWTYKTHKAALLAFAKKQGASIGDFDMQIAYLLDELQYGFSAVWYALINAASVREASDAVLLKYERPKNMSEENQISRAKLGMKYFDEYAVVASPVAVPAINNVSMAELKAAYAQAKGLTDILRKLIGE